MQPVTLNTLCCQHIYEDQCMHGVADSTSNSSPDEAMRLMCPKTHVIALSHLMQPITSNSLCCQHGYQHLCRHADNSSAWAVSDSSPDEATRLIGPDAHMTARHSSCNLSPLPLFAASMANLCMHADIDSTWAVSDSSPDEATRLIGPEAHMMAFTSSCRLSALRNLLSAKMSSTRQALMHETVL
jgi:hypothetical protein